MAAVPELADALKERITDEIIFALGFARAGIARRWLGPLFRAPAAHFGRIFARLEREVPRSGLPGGAREILPDFSLRPRIQGREQIPASGPLLLVSNHPGAYDSLAITACVPRPDLTIAVSDVPFLRSLPETGKHFIYIPPDPDGRTAALRACIAHLKTGGALLIFAHGEVEPDPAIMPGASESIGEWSRSIEIMLRKVPALRCLPVIASGVLLRRFVDNPLTRLRRLPAQRQKLGEVLQIMRQLIQPRSVQADVRVSFGAPLEASRLNPDELMPAVIRAARGVLEEHLRADWGLLQ